MKLVNYLFRNLDSILISLVLNVNVLRFYMNIGDTNVILYFLYLITLFIAYKYNKFTIYHRYLEDSTVRVVCQYWFILAGYGLITSIFITGEWVIFLKLLISVIISICCIGFSGDKIKKVFEYFFILNIVYSFTILLQPQRLYSYIGPEVNYLNTTLTLGLCFTITLVFVVLYLYRNDIKKMIFTIGVSIFFFIVLMHFPARGVLIFPPLIAFYISFLNRRRSRSRFLLFLLVLMVLISGAFIYFLKNASEYAMVHMTGLFEDTEDESRIVVWSNAIKSIINNLWIFFGAGLNGFRVKEGYYPHNIYFHIMADFGILAMFLFLYLSISVISKYIKFYKYCNILKLKEIGLISFVSFLYYLLTFCKSFSLYDCNPLLISLSFCLAIFSENLNSYRNRPNIPYSNIMVSNVNK